VGKKKIKLKKAPAKSAQRVPSSTETHYLSMKQGLKTIKHKAEGTLSIAKGFEQAF